MSAAPRVLVCDDEPQIVRALRVILRDAGYRGGACRQRRGGARPRRGATARGGDHRPDAAGPRRGRGDRRLREWSDMPIIVLSAVGEEEAKVRALSAGADDYVTKPFGPSELVARLQAVMRRAQPDAAEPLIEAEGIEIDLAARSVRRDGEPIHLTPTEFELLRALARNRGKLDDPPALARRGLGTRVRRRLPGPARSHRQPAAQDRARRAAPATSSPTPASATASPPSDLHRICMRSGGLVHAAFWMRTRRMMSRASCRSPVSDIFPGGGGSPADVFAIAIAVALFALLYWAIDLIDRI